MILKTVVAFLCSGFELHVSAINAATLGSRSVDTDGTVASEF